MGLTSSMDINLTDYPTGIVPEEFVASLNRDTLGLGPDEFAEESFDTESGLLEPQPLSLQIDWSLETGWNQFSWIWPYSQDLIEAFESLLGQTVNGTTHILTLIKDNDGAAWLPQWNFNGIGDLTPGQGYQIKLPSDSPLEDVTLNFPFKASEATDIGSRGDLRNKLNNSEVDLPAGWSMIGTSRLIDLNIMHAFQNMIKPNGYIWKFPNLNVFSEANENGMKPEYRLPYRLEYHPGDKYIYALNDDGSPASTFLGTTEEGDPWIRFRDPWLTSTYHDMNIGPHDPDNPNRRLLDSATRPQIDSVHPNNPLPVYELPGTITYNADPQTATATSVKISGDTNTDFENHFPAGYGAMIIFYLNGYKYKTPITGYTGAGNILTVEPVDFNTTQPDVLWGPINNGNVITLIVYTQSDTYGDQITLTGANLLTEINPGNVIKLDFGFGVGTFEVPVTAVLSDDTLRIAHTNEFGTAFVPTPLQYDIELRPYNETQFKITRIGGGTAFYDQYFNANDDMVYEYPTGTFNVGLVRQAYSTYMVIDKPIIADEHKYNSTGATMFPQYDIIDKNGIQSNRTRTFAIGGNLSATDHDKYLVVGATLAFDIPGLGVTVTNVIHATSGTGLNRIAYWEHQPEVLEHVGPGWLGSVTVYTEAHTSNNYGQDEPNQPLAYYVQTSVQPQSYYNGKFQTGTSDEERPYRKMQQNSQIDILEDVIIAKNNLGLALMPQWNYNGMGDAHAGEGFLVKMSNSYSDLGFPEDTANDEPLIDQ
jgi:hypothetical protein